jgi:hypothetical protein
MQLFSHSVLSPGDSNPPTQYSSQDSLPDSPYSSQSLDSQTSHPNGADQKRQTRGSMPNLNKRGTARTNPASLAAPGGGRKASASATRVPPAAGSGYGLTRNYASSDPRLQQQRQEQQQQQRQQYGQQHPTQRGYNAPAVHSGIAPPSTTHRFAAPAAAPPLQQTQRSGLRPPSAIASRTIARPSSSAIARPAGTGKTKRQLIFFFD